MRQANCYMLVRRRGRDLSAEFQNSFLFDLAARHAVSWYEGKTIDLGSFKVQKELEQEKN